MNDEMLDDLRFDNKIKVMPDRDLLEFVAVQVHEISLVCPTHSDRLTQLESSSKKIAGNAGALGGGIAAGFGAILIFILKRLGVDI